MSRNPSPRRLACLAIALGAIGAVFAVSAGAQEPERAPTLHEDLSPPKDEAERTASRVRSRQPVFGPTPSEGQNPSAIGAGTKILPEPETTATPGDTEPVHGRSGFAADRDTNYQPDLHTGADGTLYYVEVFNPSVLPFKRMSAFDAVDENFTLHAAPSRLKVAPVGGEPRADDDLFWGDLVIELSTGEDVPIPSVSPDMRILSYELTPPVPVVFSKDGADNLYVRAEETGASGKQRRLVFLAAADSRHFAPAMPRGVRVADIDQGLVRPLPRNVRRSARRVLSRLGLSPRMRLEEALQKLVYYFRSFEARPPPTSSGDILWDLFVSKAGVCRHRSFAFMIVANALGIPTRFVANEAHAWVEVWIPGSRWARIDLGGAALNLDVSNARGKSPYRPRGEDPFVQPPSYADNYSTLRGDVRGLTSNQLAEARAPIEGGAGGEGDGNGEGDGDGGAAFFDSGEEADGPDALPRLTGPGRGLPEIPAEELVGKEPTAMVILSADGSGYRGETISVSGRVVDTADIGIGGLRIDILMAPAGLEGDQARAVGYAVSTPDGSWIAVVDLPRDLPLRDYEVFASTPGNDGYQPSLSR